MTKSQELDLSQSYRISPFGDMSGTTCIALFDYQGEGEATGAILLFSLANSLRT